MMRTAERVGIAVRRDEDGEIVTESFALAQPRGRWARWPLLRGVFAIRSAVVVGQKAMTIGERLRWAQTEADPERAPERADSAQVPPVSIDETSSLPRPSRPSIRPPRPPPIGPPIRTSRHPAPNPLRCSASGARWGWWPGP